MPTKAFAYFRTSCATNVGGDSDRRQRVAITVYAKAHGIEIAGEFYDADVKGADAVHTRPAFAEMLEALLSNGCNTILVETASRFARDLIVRETGYKYLKELGISLIAVDDPDAFTNATPTAVMIRQILGAVSQFQKAELVAKLAGARARARRERKDYREGRKPAPEAARKLARRLHKKGLSLRGISSKLAAAGYLSPSGKPYLAQSVKVMLG